MNKQTRDAKHAVVDAEWPATEYPGMNSALKADITREYEAANKPPSPSETARDASQTPSRASTPPKASTEASERALSADNEALARRFRIEDGEATDADLESMSAADIRAYMAANPSGALSSTAEDDERTIEQLHTDLIAEKAASQADIENARKWGEGLYDRMTTARDARSARANAEATRNGTIDSIVARNPHLSRDEAAAYAPSLDSLLSIEATRGVSGADKARADMKAAHAALSNAE